jgi:hypothetical protein
VSTPRPLQVKRPAPLAQHEGVVPPAQAGAATAQAVPSPMPFAVPARMADNPFLTPAQGMPAFEPVRIAASAPSALAAANEHEIDISVICDEVPVPRFRRPSPSMLMRPPAASAPILPNDPVLIRKMQHTIIERRRGLRRYVLGAMAACAAVCTLGLGAWAMGGESEASAASKPPAVAAGPSSKAHPMVAETTAIQTSDIQTVVKKAKKAYPAGKKR